LRQFIDAGGNLLVLLGEGGENKFNTNINFLLEEYGIMINNGRFGLEFHNEPLENGS
jgi:intraflagellar transport protein 52